MAATASGNKGGLRWVLLAAILAVPVFLFVNWRSQMKTDRDRDVAAKARGRLPEGSVFQPAPSGAKLSNPIATSTAPAAGEAAAPPAALETASETAAPPMAAPAHVPLPAPSMAEAPAAEESPVESSAETASAAPATPAVPAVVASTVSAAVEARPTRDPMLSPMDVARIKAEEERAAAAAAAALLASRPRPAVKRREVPIEKRIELQGIVDSPDGVSLVIVNNETLSQGASFSVKGYEGKVRIVGISSVGVTFQYKNRQFSLTVSQE